MACSSPGALRAWPLHEPAIALSMRSTNSSYGGCYGRITSIAVLLSWYPFASDRHGVDRISANVAGRVLVSRWQARQTRKARGSREPDRLHAARDTFLIAFRSEGPACL